MRRMGMSTLWVVAMGLYTLLGALQVSAATSVAPLPVMTPDPLPTSPIVITAYQISGSSLQFVQLYNNSSELVSLDNGKLVYSYGSDVNTYGPQVAVMTSGLIEPRDHILIAVSGLFTATDAAFEYPSTTDLTAGTISSLQFLMPGMTPSTVPVSLKTNNAIQQRGKISTGYSTVTFGDFSGELYADSLYALPDEPPLKIVEISPRARTCEPFSEDVRCGDYIKLKILPGYEEAILGRYRLRSDEGNESVTNTFSLRYASRHGDFLLVRLRDDGERLSLTNAGGSVWLEDSYGMTHYDQTVTVYADAGSDKYIDQSWAFDETDSIWKWATPSPLEANNFPVVLGITNGVAQEISVCPEGKYRNPETNRCRSIEEAVSALAVCDEGKERNPETNRCRSIIGSVSSTSLVACQEGEERNPATNRCRKLTTAVSTLAPCQAGYERNPETNRCKKASGLASSLASPAAIAIEKGGAPSLKTSLMVTAGLGAVGYGFYEWRNELLRAARRLVAIVSGK